MMASSARVFGDPLLGSLLGPSLSPSSRVEAHTKHPLSLRAVNQSKQPQSRVVPAADNCPLLVQKYRFFGVKCEGARSARQQRNARLRASVSASVAEPPVKESLAFNVPLPPPELLSVFDSPSPFTVTSPEYPTLSPGDNHRPTYHFQPPAGFMNDPNGPAFIGGQYHIFYQHNPQRAAWNWGVCWGHAVSSDLVHWEHRPLALTPTPGGYDQDGVFSGCCVNNDGIPTLLYTGVQVATPERPVNVTSVSQLLGAAFSEVQCMATLGPDGKFSKGVAPVISAPPAGLDIVGFRDPYVWREGDEWMMLLGSGIKEQGGTALLYKSPDLHTWEFVQPIHIGDHTETGTMWECPILLKLGKWHILSVSPDNPANPILYWIGTFKNGTFVPHGGPRRLDLGNVCYAPNSCIDGKGRQLVWAWIQEVRSEEASVAAGYAGCLTLPRVLSMLDDGRLIQEPVEEMKLLRDRHLVHETDFTLRSTRPRTFNVHTGTLEIEVEIERGAADAVGIDIRETPTDESECVDEECGLEATRAQRVLRTDPHEGVLVSYDYKKQWLEVAWWQPGPDAGTDSPGELVSKGGPLELDEGENLKLRVFLDRSVVEVFANSRAVLTTRMYRSVIGAALIAKGGDAVVKQVDMWQMGSMWDPQLLDSPLMSA